MFAHYTDRPLVFLDVDGPLIPFRARPFPAESLEGGPADDGGNPLLDRLDPLDGRRLLALGCPLIWATTWGVEANEVIAPRLGLPALPVVEWPDDDSDPRHGLHWKTTGLAGWAAGRPFVWLDDEITDTDRRWMDTHHPARTLLYRVDPFTGLTSRTSPWSTTGSATDEPDAEPADEAYCDTRRRPRLPYGGSVVDLRLFRGVCYQAAARTGGTVTGFRISDGVTPNFHQAILTYPDRRVAVVCHRDAPILALAAPRSLDLATACDGGPLTFVDMPGLTAALTDAGAALEGWRVLTRADLDGPILPAEWPHISSDDLRYWSPGSLGEALFNYWD